MLRLRDIMTTDMLSVTPETSVREAMEALVRRHVSGAPVIANGHLVGVVTTTDLMMLASSLSGVPTERDLDAQWFETEATIGEDVDRERECTGAFFSDLWDDAGASAAQRMASVSGPEWNSLEEHDVSEVMTRSPLVTLRPDTDVSAAAALMSERGIHRILVTEGEQLVGIVSALDIAAAAGKHLLTSKTYVFDRAPDFRDRDIGANA